MIQVQFAGSNSPSIASISFPSFGYRNGSSLMLRFGIYDSKRNDFTGHIPLGPDIHCYMNIFALDTNTTVSASTSTARLIERC